MTDATTIDVGVSKTPKTRTVSHFMEVSVAVELLRAQHGAEDARRIALREQRRARRARSRSRFNLWTDVTTAIADAKAEGPAQEGSKDAARKSSSFPANLQLPSFSNLVSFAVGTGAVLGPANDSNHQNSARTR